MGNNTFDIDKPKNKTKTIAIDYPSSSVSAIQNLKANISANINNSSKSLNITYTNENNIKSTYTANDLTIYGNPLHNIPGLNHSGELIIKNIGSSSSDIMYLVFLLEYQYINFEQNDIDKIILSTTNSSSELNLNAILKDQTNGKSDFIFYETTLNDKTNPCKVAIFTTSLSILYNSKLPSDTSTSLPFIIKSTSYDIISSLEVDEGEWMECAYSTDHPENITTYNVSMKDEILGEKNTLDSFKMVILFIVFLLVCGVSYVFVPILYSNLLYILFKKFNISENKDNVFYIDIGLSAILILIFVILLSVGFDKKDDKIKLSGIIIGMLFTISSIIIQSKRVMDPGYPLN